jgi:hypothetical protein
LWVGKRFAKGGPTDHIRELGRHLSKAFLSPDSYGRKM